MSNEMYFDEETEEYVWELNDEERKYIRDQFLRMREAEKNENNQSE